MAKILVADDSWLTRRIVVEQLRSLGHEAVEVANGQEALERLALDQPDCILLDLLMPGMDGLEVLEVLHAAGNSLPVIVLSADIQESSRLHCLELGARGFMNKPLREGELAQVLDAALGTVEDEGSR